MESIQLLDCNNKQSSEYLGGDRSQPALFTNKLGSGVHVEQGDRVSIHNAFISEIGSDANAIQLDTTFNETKSFTYTELSKQIPINGSNEKILGYERITANNVTVSQQVFSNKFSIFMVICSSLPNDCNIDITI